MIVRDSEVFCNICDHDRSANSAIWAAKVVEKFLLPVLPY